jgi:hypothetical protein
MLYIVYFDFQVVEYQHPVYYTKIFTVIILEEFSIL